MKKYYAILHEPTKKLLGFSMSSTGDNVAFETDITVSLDSDPKYSDNIWVTTSKKNAIKASTIDTAWYNADYESPRNPFAEKGIADGLRVVELTYSYRGI